MNNGVKEEAVKNNAARMKKLFLKLRSGIYLMATLTISSEKHSTYAKGVPRLTISIFKPVSFGLVSE